MGGDRTPDEGNAAGAQPEDGAILAAWHRNAPAWVTAVRQDQIASRRLVTNAAIVQTMVDLAPRSVLDLGCGEGWLTRALGAQGIVVLGVDGEPHLIAAARQRGGDFRVITYEAIAAGDLALQVEAVVCNFSLLGEAIVEGLLQAMPALLLPPAYLVIQTLHPAFYSAPPLGGGGDVLPYRDGWRTEAWQGCPGQDWSPTPWYFRTLGSWVELLERHGFRLRQLEEPLHPQTQQPAAVILVAQGTTD